MKHGWYQTLNRPLVLQVYIIISAKAHLYKLKWKKYISTECCHVEGLRSFHEFFLNFHFGPLISVPAWNDLHSAFGRWLILWRKVLLGHIRLFWGAHSSDRMRKEWELMDQALGCGVRLRFGNSSPHFRQNLLKGGGIKCMYFSLQMCVSLAVCLGNRRHFSELDWKSLLCIFLCCETCKLCSD